MAFALVEKPVGTLNLLVYLLRHGRSGMTELISDIGMSRETFYRAVERLKFLAFAYEEEETGFPVRKYLALTRSGEEVAKALVPAAEVLAKTARSLEDELARLENGAPIPETAARRIELLETLADREVSEGRWPDAQRHATRLVELARAEARPRSEAFAHLVLGQILQKRDAHEEAVRELETGLALTDRARAEDLASDAEYHIGSDLDRRSRYEDALARFASAEAHAKRAGDAIRGATARLGRARVLGRQGRLAESLALHQEIVRDLESLGAEEELPRAYASLGSTAYYLKRPESLEWHERAIAAARKTANPRIEAHGIANAAALWIGAREFRKAETHLRRARAIFEAMEDRSGVTGTEMNLGSVCAEEGRWAESEEHYDRAISLARETGNRYQEAFALYGRGKMMKRRGRGPEARALLGEASRIFTEIGSTKRVEQCEEELRGVTR